MNTPHPDRSHLKNLHDRVTALSALPLPISTVLPELLQTLTRHRRCVLEAPPGAGKTSRVPLALLKAPWLTGGMILLEPRRMAARNAARYMATLLGEEVGQTVGYRVHLDSKVSRQTRITVVTEGILTRLLQDDPELHGVDCLLFDEFHERNLHGDLGLALALDCQQGLRPDLRLVVMSATLDTEPLVRLLTVPKPTGNADATNTDVPILRCAGRSWPVVTHYLPLRHPDTGHHGLLTHVAEAVRLALREQCGSILVFLPGVREIRTVEAALEGLKSTQIALYPLYGDLPFAQQEAALLDARASDSTPCRKIVLATAIAETSLTIEGVQVVIDAGLARVARFDAGTGMSRLLTERVSRASADQRRGRAGRTGPGVCYRLWSEGEELTAHARPEILEADLTPLYLELAVWGVNDPTALCWLDTPPAEALQQARQLLHALDAVDARGYATARGRSMARLPLHPRLAHMVLKAGELGLHDPACLLSALAGERDLLPCTTQGVDARARLALLMDDRMGDRPERGMEGNAAQLRRVREAARQIARLSKPMTLGQPSTTGTDTQGAGTHPEDCAGMLLALAYPERVAQRRERGSFRMVNGRGALLHPSDPLANEPFLALGELSAPSGQNRNPAGGKGRVSGDTGNARVFQAAPLTLTALDTLFGAQVHETRFVVWDSREEAVNARKQRCLGALVLDDVPLAPDAQTTEAIGHAVLEGIRALGLACLPWTDDLVQWQQRVLFLRALDGTTLSGADGNSGSPQNRSMRWPDVSEAGLLRDLDLWLAPFLQGITRRTHFKRLDLGAALHALLPWTLQRRLDREAPTQLTVPSGSCIRLDYSGIFAKIENAAPVSNAALLSPASVSSAPERAFAQPPGPVLAVKLQELFGLAATPVVAGNVPVIVHLLSPAGRPLQITRDLAGFWRTGYPAVRAEMRGRYPRHPWPDDPVVAVATRYTKKRAQAAENGKPAP